MLAWRWRRCSGSAKGGTNPKEIVRIRTVTPTNWQALLRAARVRRRNRLERCWYAGGKQYELAL
jgi:hypothetical protein